MARYTPAASTTGSAATTRLVFSRWAEVVADEVPALEPLHAAAASARARLPTAARDTRPARENLMVLLGVTREANRRPGDEMGHIPASRSLPYQCGERPVGNSRTADCLSFLQVRDVYSEAAVACAAARRRETLLVWVISRLPGGPRRACRRCRWSALRPARPGRSHGPFWGRRCPPGARPEGPAGRAPGQRAPGWPPAGTAARNSARRGRYPRTRAARAGEGQPSWFRSRGGVSVRA